jgi:hypothetical protein
MLAVHKVLIRFSGQGSEGNSLRGGLGVPTGLLIDWAVSRLMTINTLIL